MPAAGKSERVKYTCGRIVFSIRLATNFRAAIFVIALANDELMTGFAKFFDTTMAHDLSNVTDEIMIRYLTQTQNRMIPIRMD